MEYVYKQMHHKQLAHYSNAEKGEQSIITQGKPMCISYIVKK